MRGIFDALLQIVLLYSPVLIAAAVVIWLGVRGRARWSSPYCRKCMFDLRGRAPEETGQCPECGADLAGKRAVGFVRYGVRWPLVALGGLLVILPVINFGLLFLFHTIASGSGGHIGPGRLPNLSASALVQHVSQPSNIDEPWGWQEAANRIKAGQGISQADCDQLVKALTTYIKSKAPNGMDSPLHWQDEFFKVAEPNNMISQQVLFDFLDAYLGTSPDIRPINRAPVGKGDLVATVEYGSNWGLDHAGLDMAMMHYPIAVRIDGKPVEFRIRHASGQRRDIVVNTQLPSGEHELAIDVRAVIARKHNVVGLRTRDAAPEDWPRQLERDWTMTTSRKFTVYGPDDQPVSTITDPAVDPTTMIGVKDAVVRTERGKLKLALVFDIDDNLPVTTAFDVSVQFADQQPLGGRSLVYGPSGNSTLSGGRQQSIKLESLDPASQTVNVILTPNPSLLYRNSLVTQVWGEQIILKDVPLRRFDLEDK